MSAQIKEALVTLDGLRLTFTTDGTPIARNFDAVRSALEAAQQEDDAWTTINAWQDLTGGYFGLLVEAPRIAPEVRYQATLTLVATDMKRFFAPTLTDVLEMTAAWCRAEMAK